MGQEQSTVETSDDSSGAAVASLPADFMPNPVPSPATDNPLAILEEPPAGNVLDTELARLREDPQLGRGIAAKDQWMQRDVKLATWLAAEWIYEPELPGNELPAELLPLSKFDALGEGGEGVPCVALVFAPASQPDDATYFVVWRGTSTTQDALLDAAATPVPVLHKNSKLLDVHSGVYSASQQDALAQSTAFRERVARIAELKALPDGEVGGLDREERALRGVRRIVFTGHSIGGAIAMMTLLDVLRANATPKLSDFEPLPLPRGVTLCTIALGAPMPFIVDDGAISPAFDEVLKSYRRSCINLVHGDDIVARLPAGLLFAERHIDSLAEYGLRSLGLPGWMQAPGRGRLTLSPSTLSPCTLHPHSLPSHTHPPTLHPHTLHPHTFHPHTPSTPSHPLTPSHTLSHPRTPSHPRTLHPPPSIPTLHPPPSIPTLHSHPRLHAGGGPGRGVREAPGVPAGHSAGWRGVENGEI